MPPWSQDELRSPRRGGSETYAKQGERWKGESGAVPPPRFLEGQRLHVFNTLSPIYSQSCYHAKRDALFRFYSFDKISILVYFYKHHVANP
jgi:hypothetical protein